MYNCTFSRKNTSNAKKWDQEQPCSSTKKLRYSLSKMRYMRKIDDIRVPRYLCLSWNHLNIAHDEFEILACLFVSFMCFFIHRFDSFWITFEQWSCLLLYSCILFLDWNNDRGSANLFIILRWAWCLIEDGYLRHHSQSGKADGQITFRIALYIFSHNWKASLLLLSPF